jgi:GNAT superfamily N-acetyltransferase
LRIRAAPMKLEIVTSEDPADSERQALVDLLVNYNASRVGEQRVRQYALLLREPQNAEIVGGLYAYLFYDWLSIELLIVPDRYRGHGFGTELMQRAERYAIDAGCVGIWLNTFSFQARGFYERLGYEVFASLEQHPRGAQRFFLRKQLAAA